MVNIEVLEGSNSAGICGVVFEIFKLGMSVPVHRGQWNVQASDIARNTHNPIRSIVESLVVEPNPTKSVISLSIGEISSIVLPLRFENVSTRAFNYFLSLLFLYFFLLLYFYYFVFFIIIFLLFYYFYYFVFFIIVFLLFCSFYYNFIILYFLLL